MKKSNQEQSGKLRILHVVESLATGGVEKFLLDLAAHHDPERFQVGVLHVLPRTGQFIFQELLDKLNVDVEVFYLSREYKGVGLILMQREMSKVIKRFRPDIIHTHLHSVIYAALPALLNKVQVRLHTVHLDALHEANVLGGRIREVSRMIYRLLKLISTGTARRVRDMHGGGGNDQYNAYQVLGFIEKSRVYKRVNLERFFQDAAVGARFLLWVYRKWEFIPAAISRSVAHSLRHMYGLTDAAVVYNGIDTTVFKGGADRGEINEGEIKILHIGRFDPAKNHELLIDAFALLLKKFPGVKLQLVGDGEFKARVMEKVVKNDLVNHVDFLGVSKNIPAILAGSNILVLSSVAEGFGLVLVEAMAMGLPVVATNVGGVKEIVRDGVNGLLVEPNQPGLLAEALGKLVENQELREQMGRSGVQIAGRFDIRNSVKEYYQLYCRLHGCIKNEKRD